MKDRNQKKLEDAIAVSLEDLTVMANSEEKAQAVKDLTALYNLKIEEAKIEQADADRQELARSQKLDRWVSVGLQVGITLLGVISYDHWYRRGLKFEETGSINSPMTRNLLSRMIPKK